MSVHVCRKEQDSEALWVQTQWKTKSSKEAERTCAYVKIYTIMLRSSSTLVKEMVGDLAEFFECSCVLSPYPVTFKVLVPGF